MLFAYFIKSVPEIQQEKSVFIVLGYITTTTTKGL